MAQEKKVEPGEEGKEAVSEEAVGEPIEASWIELPRGDIEPTYPAPDIVPGIIKKRIEKKGRIGPFEWEKDVTEEKPDKATSAAMDAQNKRAQAAAELQRERLERERASLKEMKPQEAYLRQIQKEQQEAGVDSALIPSIVSFYLPTTQSTPRGNGEIVANNLADSLRLGVYTLAKQGVTPARVFQDGSLTNLSKVDVDPNLGAAIILAPTLNEERFRQEMWQAVKGSLPKEMAEQMVTLNMREVTRNVLGPVAEAYRVPQKMLVEEIADCAERARAPGVQGVELTKKMYCLTIPATLLEVRDEQLKMSGRKRSDKEKDASLGMAMILYRGMQEGESKISLYKAAVTADSLIDTMDAEMRKAIAEGKIKWNGGGAVTMTEWEGLDEQTRRVMLLLATGRTVKGYEQVLKKAGKVVGKIKRERAVGVVFEAAETGFLGDLLEKGGNGDLRTNYAEYLLDQGMRRLRGNRKLEEVDKILQKYMQGLWAVTRDSVQKGGRIHPQGVLENSPLVGRVKAKKAEPVLVKMTDLLTDDVRVMAGAWGWVVGPLRGEGVNSKPRLLLSGGMTKAFRELTDKIYTRDGSVRETTPKVKPGVMSKGLWGNVVQGRRMSKDTLALLAAASMTPAGEGFLKQYEDFLDVVETDFSAGIEKKVELGLLGEKEGEKASLLPIMVDYGQAILAEEAAFEGRYKSPFVEMLTGRFAKGAAKKVRKGYTEQSPQSLKGEANKAVELAETFVKNPKHLLGKKKVSREVLSALTDSVRMAVQEIQPKLFLTAIAGDAFLRREVCGELASFILEAESEVLRPGMGVASKETPGIFMAKAGKDAKTLAIFDTIERAILCMPSWREYPEEDYDRLLKKAGAAMSGKVTAEEMVPETLEEVYYLVRNSLRDEMAIQRGGAEALTARATEEKRATERLEALRQETELSDEALVVLARMEEDRVAVEEEQGQGASRSLYLEKEQAALESWLRTMAEKLGIGRI